MSGFDMSYEEFKQLSKDAWKEKFSYPKTVRLDDEVKYCICVESKNECKVFKPVKNLFWKNFRCLRKKVY